MPRLWVQPVRIEADFCPATIDHKHEWAPDLHNYRRCLGCLTMDRLPCPCKRCHMSREEWLTQRRKEIPQED